MKDRVNCLKHKYINLTEVGVRIEVIIKIGLGLIICVGVIQHITRTLEVGWYIILITQVVMITTHMVIRGMEEIIATIKGMGIEIKIMIGIGVGHLKDKTEGGEMIEVWVTIGWGHALEQAQMEIELGVLNVGSTTILQGNVQQGKWVGRQSK